MTQTILPTANAAWGFWGTSERNGYDQQMTWRAASLFFAQTYRLDPEQTRDLLDSVFGRHLADDLSYIPGGPTSPEAITGHFAARMAARNFRRWFDKSVAAIRKH